MSSGWKRRSPSSRWRRYSLLRPVFSRFVRSMEQILVLEETDEVLEALIGDRSRVFGRTTGYVPRQGELTYDVIRGIVQDGGGESGRGSEVLFSRQGDRRGGQHRLLPTEAAEAVRRLSPSGLFLCNEAGLSKGCLSGRYRLLHPGHLPGSGRYLRRHGRERRPCRGLLRGLSPGRPT